MSLDSCYVAGEPPIVLRMLLRLMDAGGQAETSVNVSVSSLFQLRDAQLRTRICRSHFHITKF